MLSGTTGRVDGDREPARPSAHSVTPPPCCPRGRTSRQMERRTPSHRAHVRLAGCHPVDWPGRPRSTMEAALRRVVRLFLAARCWPSPRHRPESRARRRRPTVSGRRCRRRRGRSTLYATAGRWSGVPAPTYSYRWQYQASDGGWPDIAGATGPTYEIQPADLGTVIRVNVTAETVMAAPSRSPRRRLR